MKAYVTVFTNRGYLDGVKVLKKSLEMVNSKYPLVVLVPQTISPDIIEELKTENITYSIVKSFDTDIIPVENPVPHWKDTFFKLEVFNMCTYEKVVFVDADMVVLRNIDQLFEYPHMSCVAAGIELHKDWGELNSGIMVIEPNEEDYRGLVELIPKVCSEFVSKGKGVGDQDVIKAYFPNWCETEALHIPNEYNVMVGYACHLKRNGYVKSFNDIYVYHFTGKEKPWRKNIVEDIKILLKMLIRGKGFCDLKAFYRYKKLLRLI